MTGSVAITLKYSQTAKNPTAVELSRSWEVPWRRRVSVVEHASDSEDQSESYRASQHVETSPLPAGRLWEPHVGTTGFRATGPGEHNPAMTSRAAWALM